MNILQSFTEGVIREEMAADRVGRGYATDSGRTYDSYLDNKSWQEFHDHMLPEHREQYGAGGGQELQEKDGRPPKMASFISSSRMICKLSRDINGFCFEKKLPTTVGGDANLDGYLETEAESIFLEAKCREPYSHSDVENISVKYRGVYQWLCEKMPETFDCTMECAEHDHSMQVRFLCRGAAVCGFDTKQMICHLLGIGTAVLKGELVGKPIHFLYLLYDPRGLPLAEKSRTAICEIYEAACAAALGFDFETMFGHILDYLAAEMGVTAEERPGFRFTLCDQNDYRSHLI